MISNEEEAELREKWGYSDHEIEMVRQASLYSDMAASLRADAAHDAHKRREQTAAA